MSSPTSSYSAVVRLFTQQFRDPDQLVVLGVAITSAGRAGLDLTGIGGRLSRREILINILDPSRKIDPKYQTWLVQTESGQIHSGLLIENSDTEVVIRNSAGKDVSVARGDIELLVAQQKSLMPELLLRDATAQDAADLVAFVASLK